MQANTKGSPNVFFDAPSVVPDAEHGDPIDEAIDECDVKLSVLTDLQPFRLVHCYNGAPDNRALPIALDQDSDSGSVRWKGTHRCSKHRGMSVPGADGAKLSNDVKFLQRSARVLTPSTASMPVANRRPRRQYKRLEPRVQAG